MSSVYPNSKITIRMGEYLTLQRERRILDELRRKLTDPNWVIDHLNALVARPTFTLIEDGEGWVVARTLQ